jgi:hypothetical protein
MIAFNDASSLAKFMHVTDSQSGAEMQALEPLPGFLIEE